MLCWRNTVETHPDARWRRTGLRYAMRDGTWWAEINEMAAALVVLHPTLRGTHSLSAVWDEVGRRVRLHPDHDPERRGLHAAAEAASGSRVSQLRIEAGHEDLRLRREHERLSPPVARAHYWAMASRREITERHRRQAGLWLRGIARDARWEPGAWPLLRQRIRASRGAAATAPAYLELPATLMLHEPQRAARSTPTDEDRRG